MAVLALVFASPAQLEESHASPDRCTLTFTCPGNCQMNLLRTLTLALLVSSGMSLASHAGQSAAPSAGALTKAVVVRIETTAAPNVSERVNGKRAVEEADSGDDKPP